MWSRLTRIVVAGTAGCAITALSVTPAFARTGVPGYSISDSGYSLTGDAFIDVGVPVKLPNAAHFAHEVGRVGVSLQLWGKHIVVDLSASACTDARCQPGGRPVVEKYRLEVSVYKRSNGALICSTSAPHPAQQCTGYGFRAWNRIRLAPGSSQSLELTYDTSGDTIIGSDNLVETAVVVPGLGRVAQARIVAQFAASPFDKAPFRRPANRVLLMTLGAPPYSADFELANGRSGYIGSSLVTHHQIDMSATGRVPYHLEAVPSGLSNDGARFSVYLPA
jgi:hypothetical protein